MQLPQALHILSTQRLNLGNTRFWEDRSEAAIFEKYCIQKKIKGVLALCFTQTPERYHHWKIYGEGVSGICIEFDKANLIDSVNRSKRLRHGSVEYVTISDASDYRGKIDRWPFIKRIPFQDEDEYRVIYDDPDGVKFFEFSFDLKSINSVHFSPWIQRNVLESVEEIVREMPGCAELNISQTTLLENRRWIGSFEP